jgi:quinol monooxygenase YgiN
MSKIVSYVILRFMHGKSTEAMKVIREQFAFAKKQDGLVRGFVGQGMGDEDSYFIFSEWKDEDSHDAMMANLRARAGSLFQILDMVASQPVMESYRVIME